MNNTSEKKIRLSELDLTDYPSVKYIAEKQIAVWPKHEPTIVTSLTDRNREVMEDSEKFASLILKIAENNHESIDVICEGYRYFCQEMILKAEIFFRRHGRYERSKFEEAVRDVYSKPEVMKHYMDGLLLSGVFWQNHANALTYYRNEFLPILPDNYSHLEVGPGHGALLYLTANDARSGDITGWDVSPSSIQATRRTLEAIGVSDDVALVCQDMFEAQNQDCEFDSIVVSELLEHLEDPLEALKSLIKALKPGGHILVNMPANSPAPDHLYLIDETMEMLKLIADAGFVVVKEKLFPMTGYDLETCIQNKLTITCVAIAQKPTI